MKEGVMFQPFDRVEVGVNSERGTVEVVREPREKDGLRLVVVSMDDGSTWYAVEGEVRLVDDGLRKAVHAALVLGRNAG